MFPLTGNTENTQEEIGKSVGVDSSHILISYLLRAQMM